MQDQNGKEVKQGGLVTLLCEVIGVEEQGAVVRICNSNMQLLVSAKRAEPAGGLVASEELAVYGV